jgi:pimeloyl-ACP methyl ester carboxylesterase
MIYKTEAGGREIRRRYDQTLAQWPMRADHLRLPTREGETFVVACGPDAAPPLLLFHGSGTNTTMWMGDVGLWAKHFRVFAVDMIGEPGHSASSRPPLGSEAYALWLDDVFDGLGVERAAVVGASLGGWLALDYAKRRPQRVERLALLCPGGIGRQKVGALVKALLYKPFGHWGMRRSIKAIAGIDATQTPEFAEYITLTFTQFLPRRDRLPVFSDEELGRLTMPVLTIVGARDALLDSYDTAKRLERSMPHARVILLPEVAHAIVGQTQPILDFLRG